MEGAPGVVTGSALSGNARRPAMLTIRAGQAAALHGQHGRLAVAMTF
ncbi:MAG: hypothetical protein HZT41_15620 [Dechloromonas sp.]|nr:MAG: hypothetical protein HZT41_15620 [Dechloromonas sp.]